MAQIIVRDLDDGLKAQLAMHAKQHGHSMEEEVRQILHQAITSQQSGFGSRIAKRFAQDGLDQPIIEYKGQELQSPLDAQ